MKTKLYHPIRYVARQSGLKPYLIRSWEERYGAVKPLRSGTNRRLYSDRDVKRLSLLRQAVAAGHSISSVATLPDGDLEALVNRDRKRIERVEGDATGWTTTRPENQDVQHVVDTALTHIMNLDSTSLEKVLSDTAVEIPRQAFLQLVIMPLFHKIGTLWRDGRLKIINEHMASMVVRALLWDMLRAVGVSSTAPRLVIATPVGHWHEFGALASALAASESGWRAFYFGPNLPSEEIAYAVKRTNAKALALSLCHQLADYKVDVELKRVRRLLGKRLPIFIGGAGAVTEINTIEGIDAIVINDFDNFRGHLEKLR